MTTRQQPTVDTETELLDLLRADPIGRGVAYLDLDELDPEITAPAVVTVDDRGRPEKVLAWIVRDGAAERMLCVAVDADAAGDLAAWSVLPVRHGPWCGAFFTPESPHAAKHPGG